MSRARAAAMLAGVAAGLLGWLLLVPWDLSEVDAQGRARDGSADDAWARIALVLLALEVLGLVITRTRAHRLAPRFVIGGGCTWVVLFAWRCGAARTVGANMFLAPLVAVVVPVAILAVVIVAGIERGRRRR